MKKVILTIVTRDDLDALLIASLMEKDPIAQEGLYTLECGNIEDLTLDEEEYVSEILKEEGIEL